MMQTNYHSVEVPQQNLISKLIYISSLYFCILIVKLFEVPY